MKETKNLLKLKAITAAHVGSGDTIATIDLPIQREKHTNYPTIYASSIKGAFRDHYRKVKGNKEDINIIFGTDEQDLTEEQKKNNSENRPALISFSDARLFAYPMRSSESPFIWVTCPYILKRLIKDLELINITINSNEIVPKMLESDGYILKGNIQQSNVIIEEAVVNAKNLENKNKLDNLLSYFNEIDKLLLVSDDMFDYCVTCTDIQTNIKIDVKTGTAKDGALRYQEFLPSETILYNLVWFGDDNTNSVQEKTIEKSIKDGIGKFIQIGGDETLGKGIFEIEWFFKDNNEKK